MGSLTTITKETSVYSILRGLVEINQRDANGELTGYMDVGNAPKSEITISTEKAEHYSSQSGLREKDESLTTQVNRSGSITLDSMAVRNLALWLSGTHANKTQSATPVTGEIVNVTPGLIYHLGVTESNPIGVRGMTAVIVKSGDGVTTYTRGTDYELDEETGRLKIMSGGAIPAGDVQVDYTPTAGTYDEVASGASGSLQCAIRIVGTSAQGIKQDWYLPMVNLSPNGSLPAITDSTDFSSMDFDMEILKPANLEAIYIGGRPVTA